MPIQIKGRSRGFTLVEMSIVLVIIGLIIGGILKGQEIIASARQKAVINQVNAVRAATSTYFDRYRALPGDDPVALSRLDGNVNNGNGDGVVGSNINTSAAIGSSGNGTVSENYNFFNGLVAAGLLNGGQVTSGVPGTINFGTSALPASPISGAGLTVINGTHQGDGSAAAQRTTHWLRVHKGTGTPSQAMSPRTLANIDTQVDDGLPGTGGVRDAATVTTCLGAGAVGVGVAYAASDNIACYALFEITQ
jgi:prepilin-type N-terminal cleavage/methylation domain-containing protein